MSQKEVGLLLRKARQAARMNQTQAGQAIGISQSNYAKIERGERRVSVQEAKALATAFGVSEAYVMGHGSQEPSQGEEDNSRQAILNDYDAPAGLRQFAEAASIIEWLHPTAEEWHVLSSLAAAWPSSGLVPRDGWIQILFSLRAVMPSLGGSGVVNHRNHPRSDNTVLSTDRWPKVERRQGERRSGRERRRRQDSDPLVEEV